METYKNFEFFNPNPSFKETPKSREKKWTRNDCVVRALCAAFDFRWEDAYMKAIIYSKEVYDFPNSKIGFEYIAGKFGFMHRSFGKTEKGVSRPKLHQFAAEHKDDVCIVDCGKNHYVCCRDGFYYDANDSGYMTVYSYWILRK